MLALPIEAFLSWKWDPACKFWDIIILILNCFLSINWFFLVAERDTVQYQNNDVIQLQAYKN